MSRFEPIYVVTADYRIGILTPESVVTVQLGSSGPFAQMEVRSLRLATAEEIADILGCAPNRRVIKTVVRVRKVRSDKGKKRCAPQ